MLWNIPYGIVIVCKEAEGNLQADHVEDREKSICSMMTNHFLGLVKNIHKGDFSDMVFH